MWREDGHMPVTTSEFLCIPPQLLDRQRRLLTPASVQT
jgi:hypothetical protein